jgi:hypothetical protein
VKCSVEATEEIIKIKVMCQETNNDPESRFNNGRSSGIGRATATLLVARGFRTFGTLREMNRASEFPAGLELVRLDVREEESVPFLC